MADLLLPDIGENVAGGDVVRILVNKGDTIKKDQPILELETDKATIEVPSDQDGTISEIKVKQGDKVKVGQVVLTLDNGSGGAEGTGQRAKETAGEKAEEKKPEEKKPEAVSPEPQEAQPETKAEPDKVVDIASRSKQAAKPASEAAAPVAAGGEAIAPTPSSKVGAAPSVRRMARELGVDITRVSGTGP